MQKLTVLFATVLVLLLAFAGTAAAAEPPEKVKVLVGFNHAPGDSEEALVRSFGGDIKFTYHIVPAISASIPVTAIQGLSRNPRVTIVEPDVEVHIVGDTYPWGVTMIGAATVHQSNTTGQGVKVAILDTGIDYNHPELASVYKGGYDFVNNDSNPMDDNGHGTHVAGTIAAAANGSSIIGVAPGVEIYALKVLDKNGSGYFSDIIAALQWATGDTGIPGSIKVNITNNSYGSSVDPGIFVEAAFGLAYAEDGVLNVAAAGNSGNTAGSGDNVIYPAKYDSVVAVAATDQNNLRAYFSSTGSDVELAAPGVSIYSTIPGGYATWSGTSMACPHVVGAAALVMSSPETVARDANHDSVYETNSDGTWTNVEVRNFLQATADDLGTLGKDNQYGYGLVDADEAALAPASNHQPVANAGPDKNAVVNQAVTFSGSDSYDIDGTIVDYSWDFGDGSIGTGVVVDHTYAAANVYTVTLTVTDNGSMTGTDTAFVTVTAASQKVMHVSAIDMGLKRVGPNTAATATVKIVNENGNPVYGATVYGHWSGATRDTDSGVTSSSGQVTVQSNYVKKAQSGTTFTFTIDNVALSGFSYNSAADLEKSDTIKMP